MEKLNMQEYMQQLETLVNIDSGSKDPEGVKRIADFFADAFKAIDWVVEYVNVGSEVGPCLKIVNRVAEKYDVLMIGHMDTVFPKGTVKERPYSVQGEKALGPGVIDMKASLLYAYYAAKHLTEQKMLDNANICIIFNSDEEISSIKSRPIIEKTAVNCAYTLVLEPARPSGELVNNRKGIAKYFIDFHGIAAHAGVNPESGASSINELIYWGSELVKLNNPAVGTTLNIGVINGGTTPNVVADYASMAIDIRIAEVEEAEKIDKRIRELQANPADSRVKVDVKGGVTRPPLKATAKSLELCEIVNKVGKDVGVDVKWVSTGGGSDANFTSALGIPTIDGLGPVGGLAHGVHEYLAIDSVVPRFNLLVGTIAALIKK